MRILNIYGIQILDSRGVPSLKITTILNDGSKESFFVPSGKSTGSYEAHELRDNKLDFYFGKSVLKCLENLEEIKPKLLHKNFTQKELDNYLIELDGTKNKTKLGANLILGISISFLKANAKSLGFEVYEYIYYLKKNKDLRKIKKKFVPKPIRLFSNIINGGVHSGNDLNIQEFMIVCDFNNQKKNIRATTEIYHQLKFEIEKIYSKSQTGVGDEGGFSPNIKKSDEALSLIQSSIKKCSYEKNTKISLDVAANEIYKNEKYEIEKDIFLDYKSLIKFYLKLLKKYNILSIEDPFFEDDFFSFKEFLKSSKKVKKDFLVVGDDLLTTNPKRIKEAIKKNLCNSLLLKINQIGTFTEALESYILANKKKWEVIVSHRSSECEDSFIADLAVGLEGSIKIGAPCRSERVCKYNRLLEIFSFEKEG